MKILGCNFRQSMLSLRTKFPDTELCLWNTSSFLNNYNNYLEYFSAYMYIISFDFYNNSY